MMADRPTQITTLLTQIAEGGPTAQDAKNRLASQIYDELKALSHRQLAKRWRRNSLATTVLAHEAWMRVVERSGAQFENRRHLFGAFAQAIRWIVCERARRKRLNVVDADPVRQADLNPGVLDQFVRGEISEELDAALRKLETEHECEYEVVMLRHFLGFTQAEIAETLGAPRARVERALKFAQAYLRVRMR